MTQLEVIERIGVLCMTGHLFDGPEKVCASILQLALSVPYDEDILQIRNYARSVAASQMDPVRALECIKSVSRRRIQAAVDKASV